MSIRAVYLKTFGCQMNESDSENILRILAGVGYKSTAHPKDADLILVNTCSVREKSEQKFYSVLGRLKQYRKTGKILLGAGGCVAQQEGARLLEKAPYLDLIFGTTNIHQLPELIENARRTGMPQVASAFRDDFHLFSPLESACCSSVKAYVTIMQGCDNFCSFCVVPHVRGRERSRPSKHVISEVRALVQSGVKEVMLLGQNVNSYGKNCPGEITFPELLRELNKLEGLARIRFTTSHPKDLSEELIACFRDLETLCPHLHLPVQSGSNRVLALMNRGYTKEDYVGKVHHLRRVRPDIGITTDIIVGFPGETELDFEETVDIINRVQYDDFFSFKYSDRQFTEASRYSQKLPEEAKTRRLTFLQQQQRAITRKRNDELVNKVVDVLVEGPSKKDAQRLTGRSGTNKVVNFDGDADLMGRIVRVKILEAHAHSLFGQVV